jgi:hypothetical protein
MLFFYGEGRLGNQIFQYQALNSIAKRHEQIVAVGLEDLERCFNLHGPRLRVLTRNGVLKRVIKYLVNPLVLRPLSKTFRLMNYACETRFGEPPHDGASGAMSLRTGVFSSLTFVDGGHYQNSTFWQSFFPSTLLTVSKTLRDAARGHLDSLCGSAVRRTFVHVRRGDYLTHTDYGLHDLSLPAGFYRAAIDELGSKVGPTHLVFVTDDRGWVEENFGDLPRKTLVSFDAALDFAIMTQCTSAILSNSTFSLAASLMLDDPDIVIAPRYWFGFRVRRWLPPRLQFVHDRLVYLSVPAEQPTVP